MKGRFEEPQVIATYGKKELEEAISPHMDFNGYDCYPGVPS